MSAFGQNIRCCSADLQVGIRACRHDKCARVSDRTTHQQRLAFALTSRCLALSSLRLRQLRSLQTKRKLLLDFIPGGFVKRALQVLATPTTTVGVMKEEVSTTT